MKNEGPTPVAIAAVLLMSLATLSCATTTSRTEHERTPATELAAIADTLWERQVEQAIAYRLRHGLPIVDFPDETHAAAQADAEFARTMLERLGRLDAAALDADDRTTRDILIWQMEQEIDRWRHYWLRFPITPYGSAFREIHQVFPTRPLGSEDDAARYLVLLEEYAEWIGQLTAVTQEQRRRGILLPKPEIDLVVATLRGFAQPAEESLFLVSTDRAGALRDPAGFRDEVRAMIERRVRPALQRLIAEIDGDDYRASAPEEVGLAQYPGGRDAYDWLVRHHTTLPLTAEEVHERGLDEIERIRGELETIRQEVGFEGSRKEFLAHLGTAPRFFAETPEEVRERLEREVRRVEPHVPSWFGKAPEAPYDVARLDSRLEGAMTFGYYQPPSETDPTGTYFFNGSNLDERNLLFATALMLHELVPGHHFQISLQFENDDLHPVRRENMQTAFVEGWGEYAAALGREMGLYEDPWDRAGRLMMDMLLSTRLVVDTGMNAMGWSRQRAIDYMKENTLMSDAEIATETLRYAVDIPGQALAYKTGSMTMVGLRERARRELGDRFDPRAFHDLVLSGGSMPLSVLESRVEQWIRDSLG